MSVFKWLPFVSLKSRQAHASIIEEDFLECVSGSQYNGITQIATKWHITFAIYLSNGPF